MSDFSFSQYCYTNPYHYLFFRCKSRRWTSRTIRCSRSAGKRSRRSSMRHATNRESQSN